MAVFLDEDGILKMGNKTPVTILQETFQKQGITPQYELIYNGTGTLDPMFKFRVSAIGMSAVGDGKTKKEAKHDAAAALLKRMTVKSITENVTIKGTTEEPVASPYTGAIKHNFVGVIDEICFVNRLPFPEFTPMNEEGPPHARVFTLQCKVGNLVESATARTKKQAKHLASQQMVERIAEILGENFTSSVEAMNDDDEDHEHLTNLKAIEPGSFKPDLAIPLSQMHNCFFYKTGDEPLPKSFLDLKTKTEEYYSNLEQPKRFLDNLVQELQGICRVIVPSQEEYRNALKGIGKISKKLNVEGNEFWRGLYKSMKSNEENILQDVRRFSVPLSKPSSAEIEGDAVFESSIEKLDLEETNQSESSWRVVFLQVQCPQGSWTFQGVAEDETETEDVVNKAAVRAILFLRKMSTPCGLGKTS